MKVEPDVLWIVPFEFLTIANVHQLGIEFATSPIKGCFEIIIILREQ